MTVRNTRGYWGQNTTIFIYIIIYINIVVFLRSGGTRFSTVTLYHCAETTAKTTVVISSVVERSALPLGLSKSSLHALRLVEMTLGRGRPRLVEMTGRKRQFFQQTFVDRNENIVPLHRQNE